MMGAAIGSRALFVAAALGSWTGRSVRHPRLEEGGTSMNKVMWGLGLVLFTTLASLTGQTRTAVAQAIASSERFEVSAVKAARPFLVDTIAAIQQGDVARAKEAFDAYDSAWNGIEVYVNVRSRALYQILELELQAKISKGLDAPRPDMPALLSDAQMMLAKYDEAIDVVTKAAALNPIYDELARLRIVRAHLREVNPALKAGNIAKARKSFESFNDQWFDIEDFVRAQSLDAYVSIERGMLAVEDALLMTEKPDVEQVTALVTAVMTPYNAIVGEVQRQARASRP
jgi:tetratricopeptide (TPR) repeat protein